MIKTIKLYMRLKPALLLSFALSLSIGASQARADYFVNSLADSPLATYIFGNVNNSTSAAASSSTTYYQFDPVSLGTLTYSANGSSSVDLSTGSLHAAISGEYQFEQACQNCDPMFVAGNASFGDSLTFIGSFTNQIVDFNVSTDGTWTTSGAYAPSGTLQFLALPAGTIAANSGNEFALFNTSDPNSPYYDPSAFNNVGPNAVLPLTETVPVILNGVNPTIDIAFDLDLDGGTPLGGSFDANFTDTASLSFTALPGVTVYSASGLFPGTLPTPVPAPPTLPLFASGLAGLSLLRWRRRKKLSS